MNQVKVRVTRQDFRDAAKTCKMNGHSTCRCVVANAIRRTTGETVNCGWRNANKLNGQPYLQDISHNMSRVVNLFDDSYKEMPADKMYKKARERNILNLVLDQLTG